MSKDYNLFALQNWDMTDEDVAEEFDTFPKKLLHTPDMNLWLTWIVYLQNIEANYEEEEWDDEDGLTKRLPSLLAEKNEKGEPKYTKDEAMHIAAKNEAEDQLISHITNMQIIISPRHWYDMDVSYNQYHDGADPDPEWYLDIEAVKYASRSCFMNNPQEYPGFIQDDDGFSLRGNTIGKWKINPSDEFWKTEESMDVYFDRYYNRRTYTTNEAFNSKDIAKFYKENRRTYTREEALNHLIKLFGEDNLPPWVDKIKNKE